MGDRMVVISMGANMNAHIAMYESHVQNTDGTNLGLYIPYSHGQKYIGLQKKMGPTQELYLFSS